MRVKLARGHVGTWARGHVGEGSTIEGARGQGERVHCTRGDKLAR
jgi:hypothetical protein